MQNDKVIPNCKKLIPTLKTRDGSELVYKIENISLDTDWSFHRLWMSYVTGTAPSKETVLRIAPRTKTMELQVAVFKLGDQLFLERCMLLMYFGTHIPASHSLQRSFSRRKKEKKAKNSNSLFFLK